MLGSKMMKMKKAIPLVCAVMLTVLGCASPCRDILATPQPWHGKLHQANANGSVVQRTVWQHGRLVSCWEYQNGKWTQTVVDGSGRRTLFDKAGEPSGHEDFEKGEYRGGAS